MIWCRPKYHIWILSVDLWLCCKRVMLFQSIISFSRYSYLLFQCEWIPPVSNIWKKPHYCTGYIKLWILVFIVLSIAYITLSTSCKVVMHIDVTINVYFSGLLQVQQTFDAQRAIYVDFWLFLSFCCRHYIHACWHVNLQVICFLFG